MQPKGYAPFNNNCRLITSLYYTSHNTRLPQKKSILKKKSKSLILKNENLNKITAHVALFNQSDAGPGVVPNLEQSLEFSAKIGSVFLTRKS